MGPSIFLSLPFPSSSLRLTVFPHKLESEFLTYKMYPLNDKHHLTTVLNSLKLHSKWKYLNLTIFKVLV